MLLEDKTVLVTGANRGIGRALACAALARGARRVYAGTRGSTDLPTGLTPLTLDVTEAEQVRGAAAEVGPLDLLVNNAGVMLPDDAFEPAVFERHLAVNVVGSNAMTQAFLPALLSSRGAVVNLLSCVALAPLPGFTSYAASKAAAFSLTKTLRAAHAGRVRFHAVLAGPVETDMTRGLPVPKASPDAVAGAILDAVEKEEDDIFPDPATAPLAAAWAAGPDKLLEHQFAQLVPGAEAQQGR